MKPRRGFAWRSKVFAKAARISFVTEELLLRVRTSRRWELIRAMVGHDGETIHGDVQALLNVGIFDKDDGEQLVFPYNAVYLERRWRLAL